MKFWFFLLMSFCSLNLWSADFLNWNDLENEGQYHLGQEIIFDKEQVNLAQGTQLLLTDIIGGELPVLLLTFKNLLCTDSDLQTEMILHLPDPDDRDSSIGVDLAQNCIVNMYIEPRHYYGKSPFLKDH